MGMIRIGLLLLVALRPSQALAWNATGHKVTAEIAWQQLPPATRQSIVDTLRHHSFFQQHFVERMPRDVVAGDKATQDHCLFQQAAVWPDIARRLRGADREKYNAGMQHYIDLPLFLDDSDRVAPDGKITENTSSEYPTSIGPDDWNVIQGFKHSQAIVADPDADAADKAVVYCWLLHLGGDIHQPLHSTALYSVEQFPTGDQGGNDIPLTRGRHLRALWDNLLGGRYRVRDLDREVAGVEWNPPSRHAP